MNGDPIGGYQFDHVPFFKGGMSLAKRGGWCKSRFRKVRARIGKLTEETGIAMMR
jgi:hypothetical protein